MLPFFLQQLLITGNSIHDENTVIKITNNKKKHHKRTETQQQQQQTAGTSPDRGRRSDPGGRNLKCAVRAIQISRAN